MNPEHLVYLERCPFPLLWSIETLAPGLTDLSPSPAISLFGGEGEWEEKPMILLACCQLLRQFLQKREELRKEGAAWRGGR